jgi:hypothetical protein
MIPHVIAHPDRPELLQLTYDFDAKTTTITRHALSDGGLVAGPEKRVPRLLRYPVARGDGFYVAVMDRREFGEPAFIERFTWDELEPADTYRIEHPRFGLTGLGVSPSGRLAVVDRFFPTADDAIAGAKVVTVPDLEPVAAIPINAGMSSPVFDPEERRVAMVLYDQDRCSANVYRLEDAGAMPVADLASRQIGTDFNRACVAFLPGEQLAVWSVTCWSFEGKLGVYDIGTGEARFIVKTDSPAALDVADPDDFSFRLQNTDLSLLVDDQRIHVGALGAIVTVDLATGATSTRDLEGAGAIVQLHRCGEVTVALDHDSALFVA